MALTARKFNQFLLFKLPSAWICGVRIRSMSETSCMTTVRHKWINQNPFRSMFWAVQGMAAELSTGALVMGSVRHSEHKISTLVVQNKASFTKKATGLITFTCTDGDRVHDAIERTHASGEGQTFWMTATGVDEAGDVVSTFDFEWSVKLKS